MAWQKARFREDDFARLGELRWPRGAEGGEGELVDQTSEGDNLRIR